MLQNIIVMGVSGSGKSTVAELLAQQLNLPYHDADDYHPPANILKMSAGIPLNDADRAPWLEILHQLLADSETAGQGLILAASSLKASYRATMRGRPRTSLESVVFVYLKGDFETILERMRQREGHFMKAEMLKSQFDALEEPTNAITVSIEATPEQMVSDIIRQLSEKKKIENACACTEGECQEHIEFETEKGDECADRNQ